MKLGWLTKKLEDLCEFRNGLWKGKKPPYVEVGVIRNTNFKADGTLDDSDIAFLDVEEKQFAKRRLEYGDIILEKSGGGPNQPVGRVALFEESSGLFSFSNFTSAIRVTDLQTLNFRYLHKLLYYYHQSGVTAAMQRRSTGIRNLDFKTYKQLAVPLPSLGEQERIVAILDETFGAVDAATINAEKNLAYARELFQSQLDAVFMQHRAEWTKEPLANLVDITHGFAFKGRDFDLSATESRPIVLTPGNYTEDCRLVFNRRNTKRLRGVPPKHFLFRKGDLTVVMTDLSAKMKILGNPAFIDRENVLHNQRIGRIVFRNESLEPRFLFHFLRTRRIKEHIRATSTGTMVRHTAPKRILQNEIVYPVHQAEQRAVVSGLDVLETESQKLQYRYARKLKLLAELKQSILHKAFTGELTAESAAEAIELVGAGADE